MSANQYDNGGVGDGNLTLVTQIAGPGTALRVTQYWYDWRDRQVVSKQGVMPTLAAENDGMNRPLVLTMYDNLNEKTQVLQYDGDQAVVSVTSSGVGLTFPANPAGGPLRGQTKYLYDEVGELYQTQVFGVDPVTGQLSSYAPLTTNTYYDLRGNVIAQYNPGGQVNKTAYDGAGRALVAYVTDGAGNMGWAAANTVANDNVLQQTETAYDANSNVIQVTTRQRFDNATLPGPLGDRYSINQAQARVYYSASYYDAANRLTSSVNVGTNQGTPWPRPATAPQLTTPPSTTVLVTSQTYNAAGFIDTVTDPRGIATKSYYDALGRVIKTVADFNSVDSSSQTTEYGYDGDNNRVLVQADLANGAFEKTQYVYHVGPSTGSPAASNDMLYQVQYPDPSSGNPSTSASQQVTYTVNALGQTTGMTDRNGTTHAYSYDVLGRQTSDIVTGFAVGSTVDQTVRRIDTAYNSQGNASLFTSYSGTAGTVSQIVNQVARDFNDLGQVTTEYQAHFSSAFNPLLPPPTVSYRYTDLAGGNNSRLIGITYPNGRMIAYNYNSISGIDSRISRVTNITDNSQILEQDTYLGLSTVVQRNFSAINVSLSYIQQSGDSQAIGDGGDRYTGLDRFGRVSDQNWFLNNADGTQTTLSRLQYAYDADSNRLYANNRVNGNYSELYHADGSGSLNAVGEINAYARGPLWQSTSNGPLDSVPSASLRESWSTDAVGNWLSLTTTANGGSSTETRTYTLQNQIKTINGGLPPTYDNNGNTTKDDAGNKQVYDAWNRLVQVTTPNNSGVTTLAYQYDALGRRVSQTTTFTPNTGSPTTTRLDFYYNQQGQVIEERTGGISGTPTAQYVWSPAGGNLMVERDDQPGDKGLGRRLYVLQDALSSVTTLVQATPTQGVQAVERYAYDPFGSVTILTGTWGTPSNTTSGAFNWQYFFQAGRYNNVTGTYQFGARNLDESLGRWDEMDPLGFGGGQTNLYSFVGNDPTDYTDSTGLWFGLDDLLFGGGGALIGLASQGFSDVVTAQFSGWESYVGAALGGAAAGETLLYTANPWLAGAAGGAVGNATTQGLNMLTGRQQSFDVGALLASTAAGALGGGVGGVLFRGVSSAFLQAGFSRAGALFTSSLITGVSAGTVAGAAQGGAMALLNGGNVWEGIQTGAAQGYIGGFGGGLAGGAVAGAWHGLQAYAARRLANVRTLSPVEDWARPVYENGHPGKPVIDHMLARALRGSATDPANLGVKPFEMNARKGAYEGQLLDMRRALNASLSQDPRFGNFFLRKAVIDFLLHGELEWLQNDVHARTNMF